jgi:hypothetical protein
MAQRRLRYRAPELLRGAQVRLSTGRYVTNTQQRPSRAHGPPPRPRNRVFFVDDPAAA